MTTNNYKILVIGGLGYCGTALVDYLCDSHCINSHCITVVDREDYNNNVLKNKKVNYIYGKYQNLPETFFQDFTDIILLAGQGSVSNSKNILNVIDNNIKNFAWLTSILTKNQKLIYASSSSVYGRTDNKEVSEKLLGEQAYQPYNYYDWSKQNIDQICEFSDNLHFYGLRFGTVNGFSKNLRNDVMINSMCFNAKNNGKIFVSKNDVNRPILGINDLCKAILTIIYNGTFEKSGLYNLNSFNSGLHTIANNVSKICKVDLEEINQSNQIINFKLQTKSYDFKIDSSKFINIFDFTFEDTLESITNNLLDKWNIIENFQNRLEDKFIDYKIITKCRVCDKKTTSLLNLGNQPLANNYSRFSNTLDYNVCHTNIEETFPLHLHYCEDCFHVQLNCIVNPEKLFKNYVYVSGTSETLREYFEKFAQSSVLRWSEINKNINDIHVLDIGCNDGSQLDAYKKLSNFNIITVGVDAAQNVYENISSKKIEHDIYCDFFGDKVCKKINKKYSKNSFDIIIAQNVFAHLDNVNEFLYCVKELLSEKGILLIQTSQKNLIINDEFDSCYHEHLSFFNTNSMKILCEKNNLILNNVTQEDIHGTSYIFEITKNVYKMSNVVEILLKEIESEVYDKLTYTNYPLKCLKYKNELHNKLIDYKLQGKNIIGIGSPAKTQVTLNFCNINDSIIDFIIDENLMKVGLYTPGSNILITDFSILKNIDKNTILLIMAWNFEKELHIKIKSKLKEYNIKYPIEICNIKTLKTILVNI